MTGSEKLHKLIAQIKKTQILNNASIAIGNATERAQQKIADIQTTTAHTYGHIVKQINDHTAIIQNPQASALKPSPPIPEPLLKCWMWYQNLFGLDKVEIAKQSVINIQNTLFKCQEHRHELTRQVTNYNEKLKEIYSELLHIKRDNPKYVQLTILENKSLQEQSRLTQDLMNLEKEEKDHFTQLATVMKEYQDIQNLNAVKYKYLSIIASVLVGFTSLVATMLYNNKRISNMKHSLAEAQTKNENMFKMYFEALEKKLEQKLDIISKRTNLSKKKLNLLNNNLSLKQYSDESNTTYETNQFSEKTKKYGFYLGITMVTLYILNNILN